MSNQNAAASNSGGNNPPTPPPATPQTAPDPALAIRTGPTRYEIPMLEDAEGYTHWQYCMTMVLEDSDLMSIVDGTLPRPNAATHPVDHANWVSRDRKARIQIATTLRKGPLNLILQIKTSKGCWDRLADRYQGKGNRRVAWLMQAFYRTPFDRHRADGTTA